MNILVINGSPKGNYSCTLQTSLFLQKKYPKCKFAFYHAGARIRQAEKDFTEAKELIIKADLLLFSYPVYTFLVPSQLHRFVELMKAHLTPEDLKGKFATQITTSKHFYDVTAHTFIRENCQDMGLKYIKGLSADMDDLPKKQGQKDALSFFRYVRWCMKNDIYEAFPEPAAKPAYHKVTVPERAAKSANQKVTIPESAAKSAEQKVVIAEPECTEENNSASAGKLPENTDRTIALVADLAPEDGQLSDMIKRFSILMQEKNYQIRLVNIHEFPFRGGCISCFNCAVDGTCIYKDGFSDLLRNQIQTCCAIVLAFTIRDHSMGSVFKTYDDRQFCNGHRTVTMGKPFGYLISGNYSQEENLRLVIEGRAQVGGNFLAGCACDEADPDREIDTMARRLDFAVRTGYQQPADFLGVGGMKIFRDLIWQMQGMMKADHKFYKEHGMYDFPQKKPGTMLAMYAVGALISNPKIKKKMGNKMNEGMLAPYKKVLEEN